LVTPIFSANILANCPFFTVSIITMMLIYKSNANLQIANIRNSPARMTEVIQSGGHHSHKIRILASRFYLILTRPIRVFSILMTFSRFYAEKSNPLLIMPVF